MMKGKIMVCRAEVDGINANWDLRSGVNIPRLWEPGPPGVMTQTGMVMARHLTHQWLSESNTSSHVCNFQPKWERKFPLSCHPILAKFRRKKDFKLTDDKYLMINYIRRCGGNYTRHWNTLCEIYLFSNRELSRYYRQSESQQEQKILFLDLNIFDNKIFCDKDACAVGDEMIGRSDIYWSKLTRGNTHELPASKLGDVREKQIIFHPFFKFWNHPTLDKDCCDIVVWVRFHQCCWGFCILRTVPRTKRTFAFPRWAGEWVGGRTRKISYLSKRY